MKTVVNKFAISNHTALILGVHALRSYFKLICEYELHSLPNKKVSGAKDHDRNHIKVRPPLVRHLSRNRLLSKFLKALDLPSVYARVIFHTLKYERMAVEKHHIMWDEVRFKNAD